MIIGVDQSITSTGVVVFYDSAEVHGFTVLRSNVKDDVLTRILTIIHGLREVVLTNPDTKLIAIEGMAYGATSNSVRMLAGLFYFIENLARELHIPFTTFTPTEVKKFATGKGNAKKEAMIEALPEGMKELFLSAGYLKTKGLPDLADAYFIGRMAVNQGTK